MPILPVMDLKRGQVVRGIAGRRDEYRPIVSTLTRSSEPRDVARALYDQFGFAEFYLADLDAIGGAAPAHAIYDALQADGFRLWVDAGVHVAEDALRLARCGVGCIVVGLETVAGPAALGATCDALGAERVVFSLDLKDGQPLGGTASWGTNVAERIAQLAIAQGIARLLVLDLARVGVGAGVGTETLCSRLRQVHRDLELTAGGGVRGADDVRRLYQQGVNNVLVASALHDGRLAREHDLFSPGGTVDNSPAR